MIKSDSSGKKTKTSDVSIAGNVSFGDRASNVNVGGESNVINTGGGAYIRGNVKTGGGDFVGRDKIVTKSAALGAPNAVTMEGFLQLLEEIHKLIPHSGLDAKRVSYIVSDLRQVGDETKSSNPDASILATKLESIAGMVKSAGGLSAAGNQLTSLLDQGADWAKRLF